MRVVSERDNVKRRPGPVTTEILGASLLLSLASLRSVFYDAETLPPPAINWLPNLNRNLKFESLGPVWDTIKNSICTREKVRRFPGFKSQPAQALMRWNEPNINS